MPTRLQPDALLARHSRQGFEVLGAVSGRDGAKSRLQGKGYRPQPDLLGVNREGNLVTGFQPQQSAHFGRHGYLTPLGQRSYDLLHAARSFTGRMVNDLVTVTTDRTRRCMLL